MSVTIPGDPPEMRQRSPQDTTGSKAKEKLNNKVAPGSSENHGATSGTGNSNTIKVEEKSLTPFYMILGVVALLSYNLMNSHILNLRSGEKNWDPRPRGIAKNEVIIMYCAG